MLRPSLLLWLVLILAIPPTAMAEKVALRAANGRFLRTTDDGIFHADSFYPADKETFDLVSCGNHEITLQGPGSRFLTTDPRDGRTARISAAGTQPSDREKFEIVPAGDNRFVLRTHGAGALLALTPTAAQPAGRKTPADPAQGETVEIYRIGELPEILKTAVPAVLRTLAAEELTGKQYDKTQKHELEKFIDVPSPTLKDLTRTKRRQVLGITEEYRVEAQLDGQPDIRTPAMLFLRNYADGGPGLILLVVDAGLPARGRVQGKLEDVAGASTGYQLTVQLSAVAEVVVRHQGKDVTFAPPTVTDLRVSVSHLEFSNDVLEAVRRQIRRVINYELSHNEARIRESATRAVQKAIAAREVRIPLIGYLKLL